MKIFNILDKNLDLHHNYVIEASAGTGKTFAIEHLVTRLLLGEQGAPFSLEELLVVTFTKAATRDLKTRIRNNLETTMTLLLGNSSAPIPEYLDAYLKRPSSEVTEGRKHLEEALFCFDKAQIFTIHGFCARALKNHPLESDLSADFSEETTSLKEQIIRTVRDYIRTELRPEAFSQAQLHLLAKEYGYSMEKLEYAILKKLQQPLTIEPQPNFSLYLAHFKQKMSYLKKTPITSEGIISDFLQMAPGYKELCNRQKQVKPELLDKITRFAKLFDTTHWNAEDLDMLLLDGLFFVTAFDPSKQLKRATSSASLHYPKLREHLQEEILPLVEEASHPAMVLTKIASECQKMVRHSFSEQEKLNYDSLLHAMLKAAQSPSFSASIRQNYKAVIIDEFQDTDPIQWEIFHALFLKQKGDYKNFYVVGDPKQSIYAFRHADIYTYLSASRILGENHHTSLDTNYRSHPPLISAFNALFSQESTPDCIFLPRLEKTLTYTSIKAPANAICKPLPDDLAAFHFITAPTEDSSRSSLLPIDTLENDYFFPFFVQQLLHLHQNGIFFQQCAILVNDRFQAKRIIDFLKKYGIPSHFHRSQNLAHSPALASWKEILFAVLYPKDQSALKIALGGQCIGWDHLQIRTLEDTHVLEKVLSQLYRLRQVLFEKGFALFFDALLQSQWGNKEVTLLEKLLKQKEGISFFEDFQQIGTLLMEKQVDMYADPYQLLSILDTLSITDFEEEEGLKKMQETSQKAVRVLTIHSSKGLEFDIVFALGLIMRTKSPEPWVPHWDTDPEKGELPTLSLILKPENPTYKNFCRELDAEKMRQFYVAVTRAKYRVYAPVVLFSSQKAPEPGCASPMELFLARLGQPALSDTLLYAERLQGYDGKPLSHFVEKLSAPEQISCQSLLKNPLLSPFHPERTTPSLEAPPSPNIPQQKWQLRSFTSLSKKSKEEPMNLLAPHDFATPIKTAATLPAGMQMGNSLHSIFEKIPFELVRNAESATSLHPLVESYLDNPILMDWIAPISEIVFNTLHTPLETPTGNFRLCDIPEEDRYHEIEFLYTDAEIENPFLLKGVMDLIFIYKDQYYLLDWKSNWLGEEREAYTQTTLYAAMQQHDYLLQARLYTEAFSRFLRLTDPRPFLEIFGGLFYLFVRGLDGRSTQTGIYYTKDLTTYR
jgi:exodeoxyribonuclease V beta subunit